MTVNNNYLERSGEVHVTATANKMKKLVKSFNEMMKEKVRADFHATVIKLDDIIDHEGKECQWYGRFSIVFDFGHNYEEEWREFAWEQGKVEASVAIDYYNEHKKKFITDRKMFNYVDKLIDEYDVDTRYFDRKLCKASIYRDNPYYDEDVDIAEEIAERVKC